MEGVGYEIVVRPATQDDRDTLVEFNLAIAWETEKKELKRDVVATGVTELLNTPCYGFYLVAELDGQVVASLMVTYEWSDR